MAKRHIQFGSRFGDRLTEIFPEHHLNEMLRIERRRRWVTEHGDEPGAEVIATCTKPKLCVEVTHLSLSDAG